MGDVLAWQKQDIEGAVRELAVKNFAKGVEHTVEVTPDTDHEGYPILRIRVMVEPFSAVTGPSMQGFTWKVWECLTAHNVDHFPSISYVSKRDLRQLKRGSH